MNDDDFLDDDEIELPEMKVPVQPKPASAGGSSSSSVTPQKKSPKPSSSTPKTEKEKISDKSSDSEQSKTSSSSTKIPNNETKDLDPVSMISGEEVLTVTDFTIPGPVPLTWTRTYRSGNQSSAALGFGWHYLTRERLLFNDDKDIVFREASGRDIYMPRPSKVGHQSRNSREGLQLLWKEKDTYCLRQEGQPEKIFKPAVGGSHFQLVRIQNRSGYGWSIQYGPDVNQHGLAQRISSDWGIELHIEHKDGLIQSIQRRYSKNIPAKNLVRYEYTTSEDGQKDLVAAYDALDYHERYTFKNHVLVQRTLKTGFSYHLEWDEHSPKGRCIKQWGDNGCYEATYSWDKKNKTNTVTDSRGGVTAYEYNQAGQIIKTTLPDGQFTKNSYNKDGTLDTSVDALGRKTLYLTDKEGRTRRIYNPLNQEIAIEYEKYDDLITEIRLPSSDENLPLSWKYQYNKDGLVESLKGPDGKEHRYRYNEQGLLVEHHHPEKGVVLYEWNSQGQLIQESFSLGLINRYTYTQDDLIASVETQTHPDQPAQRTEYAYDAVGNIHQIINAQGTTQIRYTEDGRVKEFTDTAGQRTQYEYEGLSQVTRRTNPDGSTQSYHYDSERNLIGITNPNGDVYRFKYDLSERLIGEKGFDGRLQKYQYNLGDELEKHLDSSVIQTTFKRDALGRLVEKNSRHINQPDEINSTQYAYDNQGRLLAANNSDSFVRFEYDLLGNLVRECSYDIRRHGDDPINEKAFQWIEHDYDSFQRRIQTSLPDGSKIAYEMQDNGLSGIQFNDKTITQFERDHLGRETLRHQGALTTQWDFDPQGRLQRQHVFKRKDQDLQTAPVAKEHHVLQTVIDRAYEYNALGQLSTLNDHHRGALKFHYDALEQLKTVEGYSTEQFNFDPAGNLTSYNKESTKNENNQLKMMGDRHFQYDDAGNLIAEAKGKDKKLTTRYHYNTEHQLCLVEKNYGKERIEYYYDPLGRRISKKDNFGETSFLWSGDQLVQEQRHHMKKTYVYEPDTYRPLAMIENDKVYHYHLDHLGTPQELTNEAGDIVWQVSYKAYGNVLKKHVAAVENNLRFQGQYFDEETGFHYNRHRYYDPQIGRYVHQDPIGLLGGMHLYQYCPNPVGWVDPTGFKANDDGADPTQPKSSINREEHGAFYGTWNPITIEKLKHVLGQAGLSIRDYNIQLNESLPEGVSGRMPSRIETKKIVDHETGKTEIVPVSRHITDDRGRPIIELTPLALGSLENAIVSVGHEIQHVKQSQRGDVNLSEREAEEAGLKLLKEYKRRTKT